MLNRHGNYEALNARFRDLDWDKLLFDEDINTNYSLFTSEILKSARQFIPAKKIRLRPNVKPWYTQELRILKRKPLRLRKTAQKSNTEQAWTRYRQHRNLLNALVRQTKNEYPDKLGNQLKEDLDNPKSWWKTVNNLMKGKNTQSLPPLKHQNKIITDHEEKATIINNLFIIIPNLLG